MKSWRAKVVSVIRSPSHFIPKIATKLEDEGEGRFTVLRGPTLGLSLQVFVNHTISESIRENDNGHL
jgi:hypothetical protein